MSDENYRDRRPPRQPGGHPGDPKRTILGMPGAPRPGLSGRTPGEPEEPEPTPSGRTARGVAPIHEDDELPDKRYMEPPSETMGQLPSELAPAPFGPARTRPAELDPRRVPVAQAGHDGRDERDRPSPFGPTEKQPVRMPSAEPPGAPLSQESRPSPYSASAPEAWRAAARNIADKAKTVGVAASPKPPPGRSPGSSAVASGRTAAGGKGEFHTPSLRLKLDSEVEGYEEHYKGVPKSRLPGVLLGLLILVIAAGGGAYWADGHGGLASWAARLHLTEPGIQPPANSAQDPTALGTRNEAVPAATAPAPNAAAARSPLTTPQPSAASASKPAGPSPAPAAAAPQATAPAQAAAGKAPATTQDSNAQALAEPDMKLEAPPAAAKTEKPLQAASADKPVMQPKAAERRRPAAPPPARSVVHHDPVLKIREIGAASAPGAPPEPADSPYTPSVPIDPPAPDEPR
jgi:hypothetical protein